MKKFTICIVGGGSRYTPDMLAMLVNNKEKFPLKKVILYDNEFDRQEKVGKYAEILFKEYYPEVEIVEYTTNPKVAFKNIDFALMQIRAGRLEMREKDEKISLKYNCVGQETCGAGGFAYGMRSVPAIIDIVNEIRKYSPKAWILNYSNPAAIVAEATKRIFPNDYKLINICDMPISIMGLYAKVLGMERKDLEPRYFGLNHFGWFTHIFDKKTGKDLLPKIREKFLTPIGGDDSQHKDESWRETFKFMSTIINDYPEYLPNTYLQYYLYPKKMVKKSDPTYTRANEVMDGHEKQTYKMLDEIIMLGKIKGTKYEISSENGVHASYIVELATALSSNTNDIFLIMTKNNGTIPNLDSEMMVEVPCRVGSNGVEALSMGDVPTFYKGLLEAQFAYEKLTVDANLEGNYQKALQALVLNRTVINTDIAKKLLDDLIEANKGYWPELK